MEEKVCLLDPLETNNRQQDIQGNAHTGPSDQERDRREEIQIERVSSITKLLSNQNVQVKRLLDVGCGEGSITASLAQSLSVDEGNAIGCDIYPIKKREQFTFAQLSDQQTLPLKDEEFDLVACHSTILKN